MKASFGSRLAAYIIDFLIVSVIISIICYALPTNNQTTEKEMSELVDKMISGEITSNEYLNEYKELLYKNNKRNVIENTVNAVIMFAYFVIFQYMNKGQTLGKRILSIRVVDSETSKPTNIPKGLLRSMVILSIVSSIVSVALINVNKNTYTNIYLTAVEIESILTFISIIFVLYRKDGRGLHDMIANTKVIKEAR